MANRQLALRERACFVKHGIGDLRQVFQRLPVRNQHAFAGKFAGGSRQRGGRGERKGARAGNHQQRHGYPQSAGGIGIPPPSQKGGHRHDNQRQREARSIAFRQLGKAWLLREGFV